MEKCPKYEEGQAEESQLFRNNVVFCYAKACPYNKEFPTSLDGDYMTLCKSKGLLTKIEIENPDLEKKENSKYVPPKVEFNGKLPQAIYFDPKKDFTTLQNQP